MTTLAQVISRGLFAAMPAAGMPGRLYIATDTSTLYYDNGTTWDVGVVTGGGGGGGLTAVAVNFGPTTSINFQVEHGLGVVPTTLPVPVPTAPGQFWYQYPLSADATYLYLVGSDEGLTGQVTVLS